MTVYKLNSRPAAHSFHQISKQIMPEPTVTTAEEDHGGAASSVSALHPDILTTHVLTRLDGATLGCAACCSVSLRRLSSELDLWYSICQATWPSTRSPRIRHVISTFPNGGPRAFFSQAFPVLTDTKRSSVDPQSELISAVDIHHRGEPIFTGVRETETVTGWFRCSPFRIDLLDPNDKVLTQIEHPSEGESFADDMTLSWILIDPIGGRAVNLSSHKPVAVQRHWLTGEVHVWYASIISGHVQCGIVVTCGGGSDDGLMQVREVSLQMEDMEGKQLNGKDSLVYLQGAMEAKKGKGKSRVQAAQQRYKRFLEMKWEKKQRNIRTERALDTLCVAFGVSIFIAISFFFVCR